MAAATSPATGQAYGVKRVCTIWGVARSSFYDARRQDARPPGRPAGRPGPKPALSDAELLAAIRRDLARSPWTGEGHRTDKLGSYPKALRRLKREGELKDTVRHRTSKYRNNRIEADHGALKQLIRPTRGFQSMKTAYATIKGFEIMRMIRRRHCILIKPGVTDEVRFVNKLFDLAA